jgi:hypothetical protein
MSRLSRSGVPAEVRLLMAIYVVGLGGRDDRAAPWIVQVRRRA